MRICNKWAAVTGLAIVIVQALIIVFLSGHGDEWVYQGTTYFLVFAGGTAILVSSKARGNDRWVTGLLGAVNIAAGLPGVIGVTHVAGARTDTLIMTMFLAGLVLTLLWECLQPPAAMSVPVEFINLTP